MGKGLLFFCCSCCILVLTIINLSVGPIISKTIGNNWGTQICDKLKDQKDDDEERTKAAGNEFTDKQDKGWQSQIDNCIRTKGMHDMEYTAFIFDIVIGFVCGLIGLLHLFDLKKDFVSNTGLIGLICGIIGFVLTFVYVIFNGIVFTSKYSGVYERDGDGIFAEQVSGTVYKCLYYDDSGDTYAGMAKISDLNKKQYNYKHEFYGTEETRCSAPSSMLDDCTDHENIDLTDYSEYTSFPATTSITTTCKNLYSNLITTISNKDKFDRFLTALILSLIVCLANIGLALFGFLLFRTPGDF
jgi:hypothetical protein